MKIEFNKPTITGDEIKYINELIQNGNKSKYSGDGWFNKLCQLEIENKFDALKVFLTPSCTAALEMSALLLDIKPGDEVIMPAFTFVSTANAFVIFGAKCIFVDIDSKDMNINAEKIQNAITSKTRAIIVVHYAGASCNMNKIKKIADENGLYLIEDAAQGFNSRYENKFLGTIGDLGTFSFHETKNIQCGEGGALLINNPKLLDRAEIIREKGTNRSRYFKGLVDKYTWVDVGSSYLLSELSAAFLYAQIIDADKITEQRLKRWQLYNKKLKRLEKNNLITLPIYNDKQLHNGHIFYVKARNETEKMNLFNYLKIDCEIIAPFHYIPLHTSEAGLKFSKFSGTDENTTMESNKLLRLPLFHNITADQVEYVTQCIEKYYEKDI